MKKTSPTHPNQPSRDTHWALIHNRQYKGKPFTGRDKTNLVMNKIMTKVKDKKEESIQRIAAIEATLDADYGITEQQQDILWEDLAKQRVRKDFYSGTVASLSRVRDVYFEWDDSIPLEPPV